MPEAIKDFLAGVASIFGFKDASNRELDTIPNDYDGCAVMEQDWAMVSGDLWQSVDDYAEEREF